MEPGGMHITMECMLEVVNRLGGVIEDFSRGSVTVTGRNTNSTPPEEPTIIVCTSPNNIETKYNLIGNIEDILPPFLDQGRATLWLEQPTYNIIITEADPNEVTAFIAYVKALLSEDTPVHGSMAALETPIRQIYLTCQEEYKLRMENIIGRNINLDHVSDLNIRNCILELAGYQVPIAGAIRKMKNLTTLHLEYIELRSSTFLEVESKELKRLHLYHCEARLPIALLFKNDLCYKDSLVELRLEGNRWSEIPNGIFEFQNLLKLSLSDNLPNLQVLPLNYNRLTHLPPSIFAVQNLYDLSLDINHITELPDMFTNLPKLQELSLSHNKLTSLPPSIFTLQNLLKLSLNGNLINDLPNTLANLPKLETLLLCDNELRYVPAVVFELQNLSALSLSDNYITELPDKFTNLSKLKYLFLSNNQLKYLPPSICSLHLKKLDIDYNKFNFEIPPSVGSEMIVHSLKELSYRAILNQKLKVKEGMLPIKILKDLANYRQCICGCKFVNEGQDLSFFCNLNDISNSTIYNRH